MKWLIRMFMPSAESLAKIAANRIATEINGSGKAETIAKYSCILQAIAVKTAEVNKMLNDGQIDGAEEAEIKALLAPIFERVTEMV